jgi:hypothetical protein
MRVPLASLNIPTLINFHKIRPEKKLTVLRSFALLDSDDYKFHTIHRDKIARIILDSGTFSLNFAKGVDRSFVTLENYIRYLKRFGHLYDWYANFDEDFTPYGFAKNLENQKTMEYAGSDPDPVVHDIYGPEIDYYIKNGYQRVALGSSQINSEADLETALSRFEGTGIKIHLMGKVGYKYLANFPVHSADTAGWARDGGYGFLLYWNPEKEAPDKTDRIYLEEIIKGGPVNKTVYSTYQYRDQLDDFLGNTFGLTYHDMIGPNRSKNKQLVNTYYFAQLEDIITDIHRQKGFDTDE